MRLGVLPLLVALLLPSTTFAGEGFAPERNPAPSGHFRLDFKTAWGVTDGAGMIDHIVMEVTGGPQIGTASVGGPPAISPLIGAVGGIAEEGQPSMRIFGGVELAFGLHKSLELVPGVFGGWLKAFKGDEREGGMFRVTLGLRVLSDEDFFIVVEPVTLVVLPAPPGGFTPYTTHVSLDFGIVKFGGRTK